MISKRLALALLLAASTSTSAADQAAASLAPRAGLTPGQVVEIQVEALQFNDRPSKDAGIATTFKFASPGNRQVTGPLERFAQIVKGPGYRPLIDHRIAGYGGMIVQGDVAIRRVTVVAADGQAIEYEFRLSRDPASNCWFTDGVVPVPPRPPVDPDKVALAPQVSPAR